MKTAAASLIIHNEHSLPSLYGDLDKNLRLIENTYGVHVHARGNRIQIEGDEKSVASVERLFSMPPLTNRDKAANDFLHLLSLQVPRSDTPTTLNDPATNPNALPCEQDDAVMEDQLIARRSELRIAQRSGRYNEEPVEALRPTPSQIGFAQVALLRILTTARYPERQQWIDQYKAITNGIDAALFMTEARLKLQYGMDFKRFDRSDNPDKEARRRRYNRLNADLK